MNKKMEPVILPVPTSDSMLKKLIPVLVSLLVATTVVVSKYIQVTARATQNGFTRKVVTPIELRDSVILDDEKYFFSGASQNHVWLGRRGSASVQEFNIALRQWRVVAFDTENFSIPEITVDSHQYFIRQVAGNRIRHGVMGIDASQHLLNEQTTVIDAVPVSSTRVILKTTHPSDQTFVLAVQERGLLQSPSSLLEKQIDGRFCTDGILRANPTRDRIIYVYYYRNEFICADSSLNLLYRASTIDTISRARISVAHVPSTQAMALASPARIVNQSAQVSEDRIYIESRMVADNETADVLDFQHVLDVYALHTGAYQFSFYLPRHKKKAS